MTRLSKTKYLAAAAGMCAMTLFAVGADGTAFAEVGSQTVYPEIFTESVYDKVTQIKDFAVGENAVAVADGNMVYIISADRQTSYTFNSNIGALDCEESDEGTVVYCRVDGATYSLAYPEKDAAKCEHEFKATESVTVGKYMYYTYEDVIYSLELPTSTTVLDGCSLLKEYGGQAYVVKDNKINLVQNAEPNAVGLNYINLNSAGNILVGDTLSKLKAFSDAEFVMFRTGAYKTEIDLNDLSGRYFKLKTTDGHPELATSKADEGETALLLCATGNAAIVCNGSKFYITLTNSVEPVTRTAELEPEFESATVCVPFDYVYASPALTEGTKLQRIDWGVQVEVLAKLAAENSPELECDYYKISYTDNGTNYTGYIPCKFLTEKKTDDAELTENKDPNYSNEDPTKTVLIAVLIISLVLTALGYLVYTGTSGKNKKSKKKNKDKTE